MDLKKEFKGIPEYDKYSALCKLIEKAGEIAESVLEKNLVAEKVEEYLATQKYLEEHYHISGKACDSLVYVALLKAHESHNVKKKKLEEELKRYNHKF